VPKRKEKAQLFDVVLILKILLLQVTPSLIRWWHWISTP